MVESLIIELVVVVMSSVDAPRAPLEVASSTATTGVDVVVGAAAEAAEAVVVAGSLVGVGTGSLMRRAGAATFGPLSCVALGVGVGNGFFAPGGRADCDPLLSTGFGGGAVLSISVGAELELVIVGALVVVVVAVVAVVVVVTVDVGVAADVERATGCGIGRAEPTAPVGFAVVVVVVVVVVVTFGRGGIARVAAAEVEAVGVAVVVVVAVAVVAVGVGDDVAAEEDAIVAAVAVVVVVSTVGVGAALSGVGAMPGGGKPNAADNLRCLATCSDAMRSFSRASCSSRFCFQAGKFGSILALVVEAPPADGVVVAAGVGSDSFVVVVDVAALFKAPDDGRGGV